LTPQELRQRVVDIVARNGDLERELRSLRATVAAQRRQLQDRPSRGAYETLAKERDRFEALWDASRERIAVLNRRIADLEKTVERVGG
jgi:predicted  nucleic acid-binding Zn-ribbon protein